MDDLIKAGKKRTILVSICILLVSIHTIYFYNISQPEIETKKLMQQISRFILTCILLLFVYNGKKWAKILLLALLSVAILGAVAGLMFYDIVLVNKIPLVVMIIIYSIALYYFGFSEIFKSFFKFQNEENKNIDV